MNVINIIFIVISSMLITWSIVKIVYQCAVAIIEALQKQSWIELNLRFPMLTLMISVAVLVLSCLIK